MTTEIAVSNRLGIALATDSAVTITGGGTVKVFNTADKLFELSSIHPIGVMINGNMDCLGVPWEILVRDFREKEGERSRPSVETWAKDFLQYVEGHVLVSETSIGGYIESVAAGEIEAIQRRVSANLLEAIFDDSDLKVGKVHVGDIDIHQLLAETINARMEYLLSFPRATSLESLDKSHLQEAYASRISDLVKQRFTGHKVSLECSAAMLDVILEALLRALPSDFAAGVVVAGYGADDTFPAVFGVEVDGRVAGKLKITSADTKTVSESEDGGQVVYFAQTDVIQRLLKGVDPRFVEMTGEFINRSVIQVAESLEKATRRKRMSKRRIEERQKLIRDVAETVTREYLTETSEKLKLGFSREFDRMIAMMPKQELIELAEALVSITAVERKATADEGTVGGPIDVAFISKHEGFVWIKRKHYFDAELNPRYLWRNYATPPGSTPC